MTSAQSFAILNKPSKVLRVLKKVPTTFMIHIYAQHVTPALSALFNWHDMQAVRCFAVLAGCMKGRIVTDDAAAPAWAAVWEQAEGTLFLAGALNRNCVAHLVASLRAEGDVLVGLLPDDPRITLLPSGEDYDGWTLEFFDRAGVNMDAITTNVPAGCELRRIDRELAHHSEGLAGWCAHFGGVDAFLQHNIGYCLLKDDTIVSEATAGPAAHGLFEMGVSTHPDHRGKGFATIVCAATIAACEAGGHATYWNCAKQNSASGAVARKMGYQAMREYRLLAWSELTNKPS
jgi:RimJ/RimL family protein N-acetyltransferase